MAGGKSCRLGPWAHSIRKGGDKTLSRDSVLVNGHAVDNGSRRIGERGCAGCKMAKFAQEAPMNGKIYASTHLLRRHSKSLQEYPP